MDNNPPTWRSKEFLSAKDISSILDISIDYAYDLIHSLLHVRCGNRFRLRTVIFEQFLKKEERK